LVLSLAGVIACVAIIGYTFSIPRANPTADEAQKSLGLRQVVDIPLEGGTSRFDYQTIDAARNQLYIAHLGSSLVTAFDLKTQKVVANIQGLSQVHGVLAVPGLGSVYASVTGDDKVAVIDEASFQVIARTDGGHYPDGIAFDPDDGKIFVSDELGGTDTVIDARTNQRVDTIQMGGEVGNTQYDPNSHRIFSAVQTRNQLVAVDPKDDTIVNRIDLPGCEHPHSLYLDTSANLAFIACEENATLVVLDLKTMQITATQPVGETPDVLAFDYGLHRLYVAAESGVVASFEERGTTVEKLGQAFLATSAHTIAVDQQTHRVYLPLENVDDHPVLRIMEPVQGTGK
jgi:DNA-binding beta-propeller fold protein YncE